MDLTFRDEDGELLDAFDALLAKKSSPALVRDAEALGFDEELWAALVATGVPGLARGAASGEGADLRQLILIADRAGHHLASAPVVETLVTTRLLERVRATDLLAIAERGIIITLALQPTCADLVPLVPAGAVADVVIHLRGDRLLATTSPAPGISSPNLGSLPLADRDLSAGETVILAEGPVAHAAFAAARSEWQLLTAAQLVGLAARAHEMGVDYVNHRVIFDRPVGAFQTVSHRLADHAATLDGARLLVQEAAWAGDTGDGNAQAHAVMAFSFAAETALAVTGDSLHYHGGYGFTLEYDIQLYFRRARALPLVWGSLQQQYQHLADLLYAPETTYPQANIVSPRNGISFDLGPEVEAFRAEVAEFLDEHLTPEVRAQVRATGSHHNWDLHRALGARGWIAASWPVEYGGQGRNPLEMMAMREEMKKRHAPTEGLGMTLLVTRAVRDFGSEELKQQIIPRAINGDILLCLGYSEPQGGSDVASAKTRAVREGDGWIINGQKVFTTLAEEADYVFLLTRTDPELPKHRGLTMFLVPTDAPGVHIDAIHTLGGERTNQTFYSDVRIPDSMRVGEVNGGWDVLLAALAYERSGVGEDSRLYRKLVAAAAAADPQGPTSLSHPVIREQLARLAIDDQVITLLGRRSCWVESTGRVPTIEGSMVKLFSAESRVRSSSLALDVLGVDGLRELADPAAPGGGDFIEAFRHSVILPIYGGASEVQRKIIAERHLGLPRIN
jgi:alkylation response protein AidB-like acyl-CoA dehydrogenase